MAFGRGKGSVIDQRLREIEKEMVSVNRKIKIVARSGVSGLRAGRLTDKGMIKMSEPASGAVASSKQDGAAPRDSGVGGGKSFRVCDDAAASARASACVGEMCFGDHDRSGEGASGVGREKFVSYFAAGHFSELRQARQDENLIRNKAIMMAVLAVLAAFCLLYHFFFR